MNIFEYFEIFQLPPYWRYGIPHRKGLLRNGGTSMKLYFLPLKKAKMFLFICILVLKKLYIEL